jgi:hypothetical protein
LFFIRSPGAFWRAGAFLFFEALYTDANRIKLWRAWLDKTGLNANLEFSEIMNLIINQLKPIIENLS